MHTLRSQRGLTLLEILLALIVLVLGVLGILALFPPALQSSSESIEETNAALIAESVGHAMTNAIQYAYDPSGGTSTGVIDWQVMFTHDLGAGSTKSQFSFTLPKLADEWKHYPSAVPPPQNDPGGTKIPYDTIEQSNLLFKLAGDDWTRSTVENVQRLNDPTDSYNQYGFSFDVKKVNLMEYLLNQTNPATGQNYQLQELEGMNRLYEVRIHVFRVSNQGSMFGGGGTTTTGAGQEVRKLVATLTKRISL